MLRQMSDADNQDSWILSFTSKVKYDSSRLHMSNSVSFETKGADFLVLFCYAVTLRNMFTERSEYTSVLPDLLDFFLKPARTLPSSLVTPYL